MKAVIQTGYGSADVMEPLPIRMYIEFPKPKKDFVVGLDARDAWNRSARM